MKRMIPVAQGEARYGNSSTWTYRVIPVTQGEAKTNHLVMKPFGLIPAYAG